jgi:hypothetical protein
MTSKAMWRGWWLVALGTSACLDRGSLGDYETTGTGGETTTGGETATSDVASTDTTDGSSESSTDVGAVEDSSTGDEPVALCVRNVPIAAFAGLEIMPVPARAMTARNDELWRLVETFDPKTEGVALELSPHEVTVDGEVVDDGTYGIEGGFVRFADVDGDGADDLIAEVDGGLNWRSIGGGAIGLPQALQFAPADTAQTWVDADADGRVDVVVTGGTGARGADVELWKGDGTGAFELHASLTDAFGPLEHATRARLAANGRLAIQAYNGAIGFGLQYSAWEIEITRAGMEVTGGTQIVEAGLAEAHDFDGDGRLDFVMGHIDNSLHLLQHAKGTYLDRTIADFDGYTVVADLLGGGLSPQLLLTNGKTALLFEAPHDPSVAPIELGGDSVSRNAKAAIDVDGDGKREILDDDYDFESDVHRPSLAQVVPCD